MAMVCSRCGKENVDNAAFCSDCGERLAGAENKTEIRGYTKYSAEIFKKFQRFHFFKSKGTIAFIAIFEAILITGFVLMFIFSPDDPFMWFFGIMMIFFPVMFAIMPLMMARAAKKASEQEVFYTFTPEAVFINSRGPIINSQSQLNYASIYKIYETVDLIYIYIAKIQAFILLKSGIEDNKAEELHNLLLSKMPAGKFVSKIRK